MNSNNTNKETTFWKFLTNNTIEIPIIQRDYAQGRLGKEYLRKSFLTDIKDALDNALKDDGKTEMKLDFVYGSLEDVKLSPLDGQQRLTTLWLLHWYIALMSGNLNEDTCKILKKFTYETRISSREFCQNLCKPENFKDYEQYISTQGDRKVVEYITSRTWFYSAWKQDPTIQSMLRMLGGTEINDKNGEDIVDGLEELFKCPEVCEIKTNEKCKLLRDFKSYWKLLVDNAPIVFYQLPLKDFGLSDDLYIKMNARGKQLTSFENFKADLVGYIRGEKQKNNETVDYEKKTGTWSYLLSAENGIPIKMDTTWTNIFWKNKSKDNKIDEIYFAFLNRFFLCELICQKESNDYLYSAEKLEKDNSTFNYLYGKESNDKNIEYVGWEKYGDIPSSFFNDLNTVLDNHIEKFQEFFPRWANEDSQFQFIPEYKEDNTITTLTQSERVVFHAISKYLQKGIFDVESFKQWMRVVWNIVENANINSIATMIGAIRLIDELGEHSHNIYEFLASKDSKIKSEAAKEQVKEEIAKANQILHGTPRPDGKLWKEVIIEAENYKFFKGAIRFLFTVDWNDFDTKWKNAQKYFDENGVKDCLDKKYRTEAILLKAVLYHVKDFEKYIEPQKFVLDNAASTWKKNILLEQGWEKAVHEILMGNLTVTERNEDCLMYRDLYMTDLLNYVANEQIGSRIRWHHGHRTVYPPRYDGIMLDDENRDKPFYRNRILASLPNITSSQRIKDKPFYKGWDINFIYSKDVNSYVFQWNTDENVYLIENNERKEKADGTDYCVSVEGIKDSEDFIQKLDNLINQVRQNEQ